MRTAAALLMTLGLAGCAAPLPEPTPEPAPSTSTAADLAAFYEAHGGVAAFPAFHVRALEALLYGEDDLVAGELAAARARVDAVVAEAPWSDARWRDGVGYEGLNIGDPIAYYGLRMLDQILELEPVASTGTLTMTAVVATCATVRRPTLPDLAPETVERTVDPRILADDAALLHAATRLFRRWVRAITGGLDVELVVHPMEGCTTVDFTDDGSVVVSYPDAAGMVDSVPAAVAGPTDLWWVVAPSGVPGDGSGYGRHFITGGMGGYGAGLPLFLSDDAWFTRKPEHLGQGPYSDVEVRAYQPQWFQHEFMHHVYRTWPQFGLEDEAHQWFDRGTWPDDFVGVWESDYYIESVNKRLLTATPPLAEGLTAPEPFDATALDAAALVGSYERQPVQNDWHRVEVTNEGALRWTNAAGASWSLEIRDDGLWAGPDCPYGEQAIPVEVEGVVQVLWFGGEAYRRR
jgi:hypothetical protein